MHGMHGILQTPYATNEIVMWNSLSWKINLKNHRNVQKNLVLNLALVVCFTPSLSSRKNRRRWRQKGTGSASKSPENTYFLSEQVSSSCAVHLLSAPRKPTIFSQVCKINQASFRENLSVFAFLRFLKQSQHIMHLYSGNPVLPPFNPGISQQADVLEGFEHFLC